MKDFAKHMKRNDTEEEPIKRPMTNAGFENELIKGHSLVPPQYVPELTRILIEELKKLTPLAGVAHLAREEE